MIARILPHRQSSLGAIEYNEQKYWSREAELVGVRNLPSYSTYAIVKEFLRLERPQLLRSNAKNISFHMAISPAADEHLTDEQALSFTDDLMQGLGYGNQPYVLYRHHDIAREHFHVVSTRAQKNGKLVNMSNDRYKLKHLKESLAEKYGYFLEAQGEKKKLDFLFRFDPQRGDFTQQCAQLFQATKDYCYRSREEFAALMTDLGVRVRFVEPDEGETYVTLQGLDSAGKIVMPPVSEMKMKELIAATVDNTADYYRTYDFDGKIDEGRKLAVANVNLLLTHSPSKEDFRKSMRSKGLSMLVTRDPSGERGLMFVCHSKQCVLTSEDLGRNFSPDLLAAAELRWGETYEDESCSLDVGRTSRQRKARPKTRTKQQRDIGREVSDRIKHYVTMK